MAGTLVITTLSDGTNSTSATNCIQGSAKAWVNFNGTGTVAIRASYNVSSITDNGTGDYTVNFTSALADGDYSVQATTLPIATNDTRGITVAIQGSYITGPTAMTSSGVRICTGSGVTLNQLLDSHTICVAVFR